MEAGSFARRLTDARWRQIVRWGAPIAYVVLLTAFIWRDGVPASRDRLLLWIVLGLLAFSTTNVKGWARGVVLEWLPLFGILWIYDILRGQADGLLFATNVTPQIEAEKLLFFGTVPTVWLQQHLWDGPVTLGWWDYLAWGVYVSYFLVTYLLAGFFWFFARERFRRYVATVSLLALMGFATYALFPAAPPWMASQLGEIGWTTRTIGLISSHIPILDFAGLFERGSEYANPVAAVPSLHAAYTLLSTIFLWRHVPRWGRPALALYPVAMTWALAYTAEHYVVDALLGFAYTIVAIWAVNRAAEWLADRNAARDEIAAA